MAQEQDQDATESMEEVIVTGSRVRRLDTESASPIVTIDKASIEKSGVTTAGDLLQRLPTVSGAATNPAVNNGGGFGEANVELRGLDAKRTLVLLNGRRLGLVGASDATDINLIPVNLIERVDVLKEGAGAIYGSDAIAGVVNFITRKDVEGAELTASYGETAESDGKTQNVNLLWGTSGDNFRFSINGNYNKTEEVSAGDRDFSEFAMYFYSGSIFPGGSSRVPTGRFYVPAGSGLPPNVSGCASVTRVAGSDGANLATDYRCYAPGRRVQLSAVQPDHDAARARLDLRELRIRHQRSRAALRGSALQPHELRFPDRAAAVRRGGRRRRDLRRQLLQPVRLRLRRRHDRQSEPHRAPGGARQSPQQDVLRFEGGQGRRARPAVRFGMELRLPGGL